MTARLSGTIWWQRNSGFSRFWLQTANRPSQSRRGKHESPATLSHWDRSNKKSVQGSKIASPRGIAGRRGGNRRDPLAAAAQAIGNHVPVAQPKPTRLDPAPGRLQEPRAHPRLHPANQRQTPGLKNQKTQKANKSFARYGLFKQSGC